MIKTKHMPEKKDEVSMSIRILCQQNTTQCRSSLYDPITRMTMMMKTRRILCWRSPTSSKKWTRKPRSRCSVRCSSLTSKSTPTSTRIGEDHYRQLTAFSKDNNQEHFSVLSREAATASPNVPLHHRWYAVPPANLVHLAIGSVYVYSMWTPGMTTTLGVCKLVLAESVSLVKMC
jgi:hypothetical protein